MNTFLVIALAVTGAPAIFDRCGARCVLCRAALLEDAEGRLGGRKPKVLAALRAHLAELDRLSLAISRNVHLCNVTWFALWPSDCYGLSVGTARGWVT
jgi:hypothetical protein